MNAQSQNNASNRPIVRLSSGVIAGGVLIMIGMLILVAQFTNFSGLLLLPALALVFLLWALLTRSSGLLIPGGILAGISAGALMVENITAVSEPADGGLFLLGFAGGWALISLLSLYTEGSRHWMAWPLIPGGIMATLGALLFAGEPGLTVLQYFGQGWPIALIAIGLYLILRRKNTVE